MQLRIDDRRTRYTVFLLLALTINLVDSAVMGQSTIGCWYAPVFGHDGAWFQSRWQASCMPRTYILIWQSFGR
jgi:hypothetical protein